jgi:hypothetical protein
VAHYLFNFLKGNARATRLMRLGMWGVDDDERYGGELAAGDLVLIYLGPPEREFVGRAELASATHEWTPAEADAYQGDSPRGVLLAQVEEWDPPVPMSAVLTRIASETAKAEFDAGVVLISAGEYEAALAVAAERAATS